MKLSKLYCNRDFHNTSFITEKGGVNLVVGESSGNKQHNLGKTKLAELLDFMLLKKVDNSFFFYKETSAVKFTGYEFYLEILLNSGRYVTIKRTVDDRNKKVAFKCHDRASEGYILYDNFDKILPLDKAKNYLNELLAFDFCIETGENYRGLIGYSLRAQSDYEPKNNTIFQLNKFSKWKLLLFCLLGFQCDVLKGKYALENSIKEEKKAIKAQENDSQVKTEDKDLLIGKISNAEFEKTSLAKELESLDFYRQDMETIQRLVGDIEQEIAILNTLSYNLEYDITRLKESIRNKFSFDLNRVKGLFEEVQLYFPERLAKSYEQLIQFNHQITQERNDQIRQTLQEKEKELIEINAKLRELNKQREEHRDLIQDTSLFRKYATYQKKLVEIERELSRYQTQLEAIEAMGKQKEHIEETKNTQLQSLKEQLQDILDNTAKCELYMSIRTEFSRIAKRILKDGALITIKLNSNHNVDFKAEFPSSEKADGNTYYKILCVAFDLAVLINYRKKSHFRFVYHDDVISGDDNGVKSRLIEVVSEIAREHDIQYIFSAIKDNLPPVPDLSNNIILKLHDKDDSGKLFKMTF
jgi:uncharacterized protein YydD (DUF2326 family)